MNIKKLLSDSLYTFISTAFSRLVFIALSIISADLLIRDNFQSFSVLISTVNMIIASVGFALGSTVLKKAVKYQCGDDDENEKNNFMSLVTYISFLLVLLLVLSLIALPKISNWIFLGNELVTLFMILSAVIGVASTVASYLIVSLEMFKTLSKIRFVSSLCLILSTLIIYYVDNEETQFYLLMFFYLGHFITLLFWFVFSYYSNGWKLNLIKLTFKHNNGMLKLAFPAFLSNFTYAAVMWLQMIVIYKVSGERELASKVAVALTWYNAIVFLPQILSSVILPKLLKARDTDFKLHMYRGVVINTISVTIAVIGVFVLSTAIDGLYSKQFESISTLVLIMALSAYPNAWCKLTGQYFLVKDKMLLGFIFNLGWGIVYTAVTYFLIPIYNEYAVGIGLIVSYFFLLFSQMIYFKRVSS